MSVKRRVLMAIGVVLVFGVLVGSASAEGLSPWFHLASVSRPGNLAARTPSDTVQEIVVTASSGKVVAVEPVSLTIAEQSQKFELLKVTEFAWDATASVVQSALAGIYTGNPLTVSGGPSAVATGNVTELSSEVTGLSLTSGAFVVGEQISGRGIAAATTVLAVNVGAGTLTLSQPATETNGGDELAVLAPYVVRFPRQALRAINTLFGAPATVTLRSEGAPDGYVVATAVNVGEAGVDVSGGLVRLVDTLPVGLVAVSAEANTRNNLGVVHPAVKCVVAAPQLVECSYADKLPPYQQIELVVGVVVQGGAHSGELNGVSVSGGGAPPAHIERPIVVSGSSTPFGVEDYSMTPEEVGGGTDVQAGSHPFQLTTTFSVKQVPDPDAVEPWEANPVGLAKDLAFKLPAGLIGNPTAVARCTLAQFNGRTHGIKETNLCPAGSVVGVATVSFNLEHKMETATLPLYNLEPGLGEPARFGFQPAGVPVILDAAVRTGEDYGVTVSVHNVSQAIGFLANTVTFWGVPGSSVHDGLRGTSCLAETGEDPTGHGPCQHLEEAHPPPFLTLPPSCSGSPLQTSVTIDSWAEPQGLVSFTPQGGEELPVMHGCGLLPFAAELHVASDQPTAATPSGLRVDVHVPQEEALNPEGLAPGDVKNITVTLPEEVHLNPAAADGLGVCTLAEIGFKGENPASHILEFTPGEASCPDASKIATVTLRLPILPKGQDVKGFVYLASPQNFSPLTGALAENPFSSLIAMYIVAKDPVSGILVKLPMRGSLSPTGQITTTIENNPQAPFEDAEIAFFGGNRAPLATPARCGTYPTSAAFEPWSNTPEHTEVLHASSSPQEFAVTSGVQGTPCPGAALPFSPSLASESLNINAGNFTTLSTTLSRGDGQQPIQSVTLHYPPGLSGILTGIPLCPEAQANAGTCSQASKIGETIVSVGVGPDPYTVTGGSVYLTEKYGGAPFGLSIVNPAKAGPYDLQEGRPVVVRATIEIDPHTAALTISTGAIPTIIEGFPLQIQHVSVQINRPGFTFNPTNCSPTSITGQVNSSEHASSPVSVPFQVTNCAILKFTPKFTVSTKAKTSKAQGASLTTKLTEPAGALGTQANVKLVKVDLPRQLPSQLKTLQKACLAKVFETNHAACPPESIVGQATVTTPLLPVPLTGPAYFVSHGGEAFPSLTLVLQGYGVTVELIGSTFIKNGITSSTFKTTPDTPFNTFELTFHQGKYAALAANLPAKAKGSFCGTHLTMPTLFIAQNGQEIHQTTPIHIQGCTKPHPKKHTKHKTTKHPKTKH